MLVEELMARPVHTCRPYDNLRTAARIMWERDIGFVPIVDQQQRIVGVITDRDICMAAMSRGSTLESLRVADAMAQQVRTARTTDTIEAAEQVMKTNQIRRLPVVSKDGSLAGVLSLNDIALEANNVPGKNGVQVGAFTATMARICQHRGDQMQQVTDAP
jgi:CBS domain-containing protein